MGNNDYELHADAIAKDSHCTKSMHHKATKFMREKPPGVWLRLVDEGHLAAALCERRPHSGSTARHRRPNGSIHPRDYAKVADSNGTRLARMNCAVELVEEFESKVFHAPSASAKTILFAFLAIDSLLSEGTSRGSSSPV